MIQPCMTDISLHIGARIERTVRRRTVYGAREVDQVRGRELKPPLLPAAEVLALRPHQAARDDGVLGTCSLSMSV